MRRPPVHTIFIWWGSMPEEIDDIVFGQFDPVIVGRMIFSIAFVLALYLVATAFHRLIVLRIDDPPARVALHRAVNYVAVGVGLIVLGVIWLERLGGFSVALGFVAAGAVVAAREIIASVGGWVLITSGRAYRIDDRIEMAGIQGDVIAFGVLRTTLMEIGNWVEGDQHTGRIVTISNSAVFQQPLYNYTRHFSFIWDEIHVPIAYHSNWRKAREICLHHAEESSRQIMLEARNELDEMRRRFVIGHAEISASVYTSFNDNWVELAVRYLTPVRGRRAVRDGLSRSILAALQEAGDITIASQTISLSGALGFQQRSDGS